MEPPETAEQQPNRSLQGADLRNRDFRGADLRGADLRGADLRHAKLGGATLTQAVADEQTQWPAGFDPHQHKITRSQRLAAATSDLYSYDELLGCLLNL
jgi:uncharacterized protein YjbI with pentapeptide repeats